MCLWHTKLPVKDRKRATFGTKCWRRITSVVACSVCNWSEEEAEIWSTKKTKLNDSAGLKGAALEYRRKGHWELEGKNQQVFLKLKTVTRNKVSGKTWIEELNFRLVESWVMKNTSNSYLKLLLGTSMIKHRKCASLILINKSCWVIYRLSVPRKLF